MRVFQVKELCVLVILLIVLQMLINVNIFVKH